MTTALLPIARRCVPFALALAVGPGLAAPAPAAAHEVPADVTVQAYVRPQGERMQLLLRVPLASLRDIEFPLRGPGYLDLARTRPLLGDAAVLWIADYVRLYENGAPLGEERVVAARVSAPYDRTFGSFDAALAHVTGAPLPADVDLYWEQALLDVLLEVPIASAASDFSIDPALAHLGLETVTVIHFLPPGGAERVFRFSGNPGVVHLDPGWTQAAWSFVKLGVVHILGGIDHLLFVLCLVLPLRSFGRLVPVVTAFTVAHSLTLGAAAFGIAPDALWFPPLIEALIALSIVYMAFENIVGTGTRRRWMIAFGFGLVHGFGFSFVLRESLQFAGTHMVASLLAFNVGVELGQLAVLLAAIPALELLFRKAVPERTGVILISALVAHTAWHWMTERGAALGEYRYRMPALDTALLAASLRWTMLLLIAGGTAWLLSGLFGRLARRGADDEPRAGAQSMAKQ